MPQGTRKVAEPGMLVSLKILPTWPAGGSEQLARPVLASSQSNHSNNRQTAGNSHVVNSGHTASNCYTVGSGRTVSNGSAANNGHANSSGHAARSGYATSNGHAVVVLPSAAEVRNGRPVNS